MLPIAFVGMGMLQLLKLVMQGIKLDVIQIVVRHSQIGHVVEVMEHLQVFVFKILKHRHRQYQILLVTLY